MTENGLQDSTKVVGRWSCVPLNPELVLPRPYLISPPLCRYVDSRRGVLWKKNPMYMNVCIVAQFGVSRIQLPMKADTSNSSKELPHSRVLDDWPEKSKGQ